VLTDVHLPAFWDSCGPCAGLPRAALHQALGAGVPVGYGLAPTAIECGPETVEVRLSDGSRREADLVVGADGIRSGVRGLLGDTRPPRRLGRQSWRFLVELPGVDAWTALLGAGTSFLLVPVGAGRVYCYADTGSPGELRELFRGFADPVPAALDLLGDPREAYMSPLEEVVPPVPVADRVVLVGDAAHATSPSLAQGAAMAAEDALVLAEELRAHPAVPAAVAAFTARRAPRTAWVRRRAHHRDRTRGLPAAVRNTTLRLAGERLYRADYRLLLADP
jgi:2-polyprenyl-6-methoxyphenol hydroxylase-like FAD-dependent oxidoreductase